MENKQKPPFYERIRKGIVGNYWVIVLLVAICTLIIYAIWNWKDFIGAIGSIISVLMPFIIAILLAYLITPLIHLLEKAMQKLFFKGKAKKACWIISICISYILVIGVIVLSLVYVIPEVADSIRSMNVRKMYDSGMKYIHDLQKQFPVLNNDAINKKLQEFQPDIINFGTNAIKYIFPAVYNISVSIVTVVINVLLSIVISCYIVIDKKNIKKNTKRVVYAIAPRGKAQAAWNTILECNHIFNGFLTGKMIDSIIIGVLCLIAMTVIGLPYAVLISLFVGVTNMIPYFGPFIGAVPGVVIYLLINPTQALIFAVLILVLQQFDGLYLGPKILGDLTGLKPLWVIFAITVGGAYFGVLGMFLGVPVVAVLAYLMDKLVQRLLDKKKVKDL